MNKIVSTENLKQTPHQTQTKDLVPIMSRNRHPRKLSKNLPIEVQKQRKMLPKGH